LVQRFPILEHFFSKNVVSLPTKLGHIINVEPIRVIWYQPFKQFTIMATLTNEQIEQKLQLQEELISASAIELNEDELEKAAGGQGPSTKAIEPTGTVGNPGGNASTGEGMMTNPRPKFY
jgi:hypothetical protein